MSQVQYRVDAEGRYWLPEHELNRLEAERDRARAEAQAERDDHIAEQMRLIEEEAAAELEEALKPLTSEQIAELAERKANDPTLYEDQIEKLAARQVEIWPVPPLNDLEGFPPSRAMLIRFREWIQTTEEELRVLRENRFQFLHNLGVPGDIERQIADLVQGDVGGLLNTLRSQGKIGSVEFRSHERDLLEQRLGHDRHAAEVAKIALTTLEVEIDVLVQRIHYLRKSLPGYVNDALLEAVGPRLAREYAKRIRDLEATTAKMLGLAKVARTSAEAADGFSPFGYFVGPTFEVVLPRFTLNGLPERPAIQADDAKVAAAAVPWAELADLWGHNPRADLPESK